MHLFTKVGIAFVGSLTAIAVGGTVFIGSGMYDIGADDRPAKIIQAIVDKLRDHSIDLRARRIDTQYETGPKQIPDGAQRYAALCVGCHLAPGVTNSDLRKGLYPRPPNLAQQDIRDSRRAFWAIKHGIKMSAMPAWAGILNDEAIWDIVSFLRQMPTMSPETYQQLSMATH